MAREPNAYLHTVERMEPDITPVDHSGAIASIAISLKRIADVLERINETVSGSNAKLPLMDHLEQILLNMKRQ